MKKNAKCLLATLYTLALLCFGGCSTSSPPPPKIGPSNLSPLYATSAQSIEQRTTYQVKLMFLKTNSWKGKIYEWKHEAGAPVHVTFVGKPTFDKWEVNEALSSLERNWGFFDSAWYHTVVEDKKAINAYTLHKTDGASIEINEPTAHEIMRIIRNENTKRTVEAKFNETTFYHFVDAGNIPTKEQMTRLEPIYQYKVQAKIWSKSGWGDNDAKTRHKNNTVQHFIDIDVPEFVYKNWKTLWPEENKSNTYWVLNSTVKLVGEKFKHYPITEDPNYIKGYDKDGRIFVFPK